MDSIPTQDETVALLVAAWTEALGTAVTPDSDFLALGGNSLTALGIAEAVVSRFPDCEGIDVCALEAMFACHSLAEMAEALRTFAEEQAGAKRHGCAAAGPA
jgi:hypothetical protein